MLSILSTGHALVVDCLVDEGPGGGAAALPGVGEDRVVAELHGLDRGVGIEAVSVNTRL